MTRKETALDALNKKIPKLEEKWTIVNKVDRRREKNQKSSSN